MKNENILKGRLLDLAEKSYNQNIYTFTPFLGLGEQSIFHSIEKEIGHIAYTAFGGYPDSERVVVRFGDAGDLAYETPFPITCLKITPSNAKFSGTMSHRDCLGAIMNLGIERELLGDIIIKDNEILIFCLDKISEYIKENLLKIRHTSVVLSDYDGDIGEIKLDFEDIKITLSSLRLDALISKVFRISRDEGVSLFREERVFVNGRLITGNSHKPKDGDIISVRKMGRFRYNGESGTTRKGKIIANVLLY